MPAYCVANTNSMQSASLKQDSDVSKASGDQERSAQNKVTQNRISKTFFIFQFWLKPLSHSCEHRTCQKEIVSGKFNPTSSLQFLFLPEFIHYFFSMLCIHISKNSLCTYHKKKFLISPLWFCNG